MLSVVRRVSTRLAKPNPSFNGVKYREYKICVHKTNAMKSSSEDCKNNPLISLAKKKVIQHDFYSANYCESPSCEQKVCKTTCDTITKTEYLGHGTHSDSTKVPGAVYLSAQDAENNQRLQYGKFYKAEERSKPSTAHADETLDATRTENVNNNSEMLNNIAMYKKFNE